MVSKIFFILYVYNLFSVHEIFIITYSYIHVFHVYWYDCRYFIPVRIVKI